jgi:hypothetical protein
MHMPLNLSFASQLKHTRCMREDNPKISEFGKEESVTSQSNHETSASGNARWSYRRPQIMKIWGNEAT